MVSEVSINNGECTIRLRVGDYVPGQRPQVWGITVEASRPITAADLFQLEMFGIELHAGNGNGVNGSNGGGKRPAVAAAPEPVDTVRTGPVGSPEFRSVPAPTDDEVEEAARVLRGLGEYADDRGPREDEATAAFLRGLGRDAEQPDPDKPAPEPRAVRKMEPPNHTVVSPEGDKLPTRPRGTNHQVGRAPERVRADEGKSAYRRRPSASEFSAQWKKFNGDRNLICAFYQIDGKKLSNWKFAYKKEGLVLQ